MKRQGDRIHDFFLKGSKLGTNQIEFRSGISSPDGSHPGTSQERECYAQASQPSPVLLREESGATEASAFDQDDGEPVPGDTTDLFPAVSSTAFAPLKGPSGVRHRHIPCPKKPPNPNKKEHAQQRPRVRPSYRKKSRPASPVQSEYATQKRANDQHAQPPPNPQGRANRASSPRCPAPDSSHNQARGATNTSHTDTEAANKPHPTQNDRPTQMQAPGQHRHMHPP
ncbi:hypothetical protein CRENBAI_022876 [Crenichthys baileyi]|uniref:Uncharacterized protein n=1 Tax=Crenichthys baileyi TaxID=28760 RepID=A0AAV9R944_9TELE